MNNSIYELSLIVQNGGYIKSNIDTAIELYKYNSTTHKCIKSSLELIKLSFKDKYKISSSEYLNILQYNVTRNNIISSYLLINYYIKQKKYAKVNDLLITQIDKKIYQSFYNEYIEFTSIYSYYEIYFIIGLYYIYIDTSHIDEGILFLRMIIKYKRNTVSTISKYILHNINKSIHLIDCYNDGDLYSAYLLAKNESFSEKSFDYLEQFINRYNIKYYNLIYQLNLNLEYIPTQEELKDLYDKCNLYVAIYSVIYKENYSYSKIITNYIKNPIYSDNSNLNYILSIAGYILNIEPAITFFNYMLNSNNTNTDYYLGKMYYSGYGTSVNINKALYHFNLFIEDNKEHQNNKLILESYYYLIEILYNQKQYDTGLELFKHFENYNYDNKINYIYSKCYYMIGLIYDNLKDYSQSLIYYNASANLNNADALYQLGLFYKNGIYVKQNINLYKDYLEKATKYNHPNALCELINYKLINDEDNSNHSNYIKTLNELSNQNNSNALFYLGNYYLKQNNNLYKIYLEKAANFNNPLALYVIANIYKNSNINKYIEYIELSIKYGNKDAIKEISMYYYDTALMYKSTNKIDNYLTYIKKSIEYDNELAIQEYNDYIHIQKLRKDITSL